MRIILLLAFGLNLLLSGQNRPFDFFKLTGEKPGPTLLVFGGIHGNEPGGYFAPVLLACHYRIEKGSLWVTPNLNFDSILRFRRGIYGDMNRKFAKTDPKDPDRHNIERVKKLILSPEVDLILNLHDGHGYYRNHWQNAIFNPKAWGQACIIDQKCIDNAKFGNLDELARKVSEKLNTKLFKNHHIFNVKNTETKIKDEQMRLSLTYFAVTHGKPAMAIETSKNLKNTPMKVLYQLRAIEAFMDVMGIAYSRDFDLNLEAIDRLLHQYGDVVINGNFLIHLDDVDKILRHVPLKPKNNRITQKEHPLAALVRRKGLIDVMIGPWKVTTLYPESTPFAQALDNVTVIADGKPQKVSVPGVFRFKKSFMIQAPDTIRVNVIGFSKKGTRNENHLTIHARDLLPKFAMDRPNARFRVEFYEKNAFGGMIVAHKVP